MKSIKLLVSGLLILILSETLLLAESQKHILVIESYHKEHIWVAACRSGLKKRLGNQNVKFSYFEMDTKRIPKNQIQLNADKAWKLYLSLKPDLVVLGDDHAISLLGPKLKQEGKTPVVYMGLNNNPRKYDLFPVENITGVLERPHMKRSVRLIKQLLDNKAKKVLILFDNSNTSEIAIEEAFRGKNNLKLLNVQVEVLSEGNWEKWQSTVKLLKSDGYDAVVIGLYHTLTDASGKHIGNEVVAEWTAQNTPVPPFAFWDITVSKDKAIGGLVLFGESQGESAAELIIKIFNGASPQNLHPVISERGKLLFSRAGLKKWGLSASHKALEGATYID